jgi:hypothetical protein
MLYRVHLAMSEFESFFSRIYLSFSKFMEKLISVYGRLHDIENDIVDRLKSD